MKILLLTIGKTKKKYLINGISEYQKRLRHYINFEMVEILNVKANKKRDRSEIINYEGELILKFLKSSDYVVLLDSEANEFNSVKFAAKIQSWMLTGKKRLVFVIGGAYGLSFNVKNRGNEILSLSKMTFSHQMVRLFFVEQLYRGYTILNNEPYHN